MKARLFGLETELAFSAVCKPGRLQSNEEVVYRFMRWLRSRRVCLDDGIQGGIFLPNGGRVYVDCSHPELNTPECSSPTELVRYQEAGERMIDRAMEEFAGTHDAFEECRLSRCNVDYGGIYTTFGSHESYLHEANPALLPIHLIPHLVSRVIYAGAGGFNPLCTGIEFTLSPRSFHLVREQSGASTRERGIFHSKNEPLCRSYNRLHLLCGESLCSQTATWLRVGTTALILALIEAGQSPGGGVQLTAPVEALRTFARDPTCSAVAGTADGRGLTAVMIQRHYLNEVERNLNQPFMPDWAEPVCREWRRVLDLLRDAPSSVARILDWSIKYALYRDAVEREGFTWESLSPWNRVMAELTQCLARKAPGDPRVPVDVILSASSPVADDVRRLTPWVTSHGLDWQDLNRFVLLRSRMMETDMRFGQLGERGIFRSLDRASVLEHRVPDVGDVDAAIEVPPSFGRAKLRGNMVRTLPREHERYLCGWDSIVDLNAGRMLDLADPFNEHAEWEEGFGEAREPDAPLELTRLAAIERERRARTRSRAIRFASVVEPPEARP